MIDFRNAMQRLDSARQAGGLESLGAWSLDRCCQHLGRWIEFSIDGFPFRYPFRYRLLGRLARVISWRSLVRLATRPGFVNPRCAEAVEPDVAIADGAGVAYLLRQLDRLDAGETMTQPSPVEGPISHDQWWYFHLRHAELHLRFQRIRHAEGGAERRENGPGGKESHG